MKYIFTTLCLLFIYSTNAQEKLEFVDVNEIVKKMAKAAEDENFDEVLNQINKVPKNDSLYCSLLISKSYFLMQKERFEESLKVYDEAVTKGCKDELVTLKLNQAALYLSTEEFEKSLQVSQDILNSFPYHRKALYNKALALQKLGRYDESSKGFQDLIKIHPLNADAHLQLGLLCYNKGLTAQALLSFNTWMLLNDDLDSNVERLSSLNKLSYEPYEGEPVNYQVSEEDGDFATIDKILDQGLALQDSYKTNHKVDIQLVRQNHILFTYLKDHKQSNGFWSSVYIPMYKQLMEEDKFNEFIYYITQSLKESDYKSLYRRNSDKAIETAREMLSKYLVDVSQLGGDTQYHYDNGILQAIGKTDNGEPVGDYIFLSEEGFISSKGSFNEKGQQHGPWEIYFRNGQLRELITFKNGKKDGLNEGYYENGQKEYQISWINGEATGLYENFSVNGALIIRKNLKKGENDGAYEGYFDIGKEAVEYQVTYKKGEINGDLKEFYSNGELYKKTVYKNNLKNGVEKIFNIEGTLISEMNYVDDQLDGLYKKYHFNGNLKENSTTKNNSFIGESISYHNNGQIALKISYNDSGKLDGLYQEFLDDGSLWYEYEYSNGKLNKFTYFNKEGEVLSTGKKRGGDLNFKAYSSLGFPLIEGIYDRKDGKKGLWKYYNDESGFLESEGNYIDNQFDGKQITYYPSGTVKDVNTYEMGELKGYGALYYPGGAIKVQGYFIDGERHGLWEQYYVDGTIETRTYYHKGQLNNWKEYYDVKGKIYLKELYSLGELKKEIYYSDQGKSYMQFDYPLGSAVTKRDKINQEGGLNYSYEIKNGVYNGTFTRYDENQNILTKGNYLNGGQHGIWQWFYPNGKLEAVQNYTLNRSHGEAKGYYENGTLEYIFEYQDDQRHGEYLSYYENGVVSTASNYLKGKLHGERKQYDHLGNLQIIRIYEHGVFVAYTYLDQNGKLVDVIPVQKETASVKSFYENGQVSRQYELKNGEIEGLYTVYYNDGQLLSTTNYVNGLMDGEETDYYPNGKVKVKNIWLKDEKHGAQKEYFENGKLKSESEFVNGKMHGKHSTYNNKGELIKTQRYLNDILQFQ